MLKPNIRNIILFFVVKYLILYILIMLKDQVYTLIEVNRIKNLQDAIFYLVLFLLLPAVNIILFSVPIYYCFRLKKSYLFGSLMGVFLILEYFIYIYLTSQKYLDINGVLNGVISLLVFVLFFFRNIAIMFRRARD